MSNTHMMMIYHKSPDGFMELAQWAFDKKFPDAESYNEETDEYHPEMQKILDRFEYGEYATINVEFDADLNVVGGGIE